MQKLKNKLKFNEKLDSDETFSCRIYIFHIAGMNGNKFLVSVWKRAQ